VWIWWQQCGIYKREKHFGVIEKFVEFDFSVFRKRVLASAISQLVLKLEVSQLVFAAAGWVVAAVRSMKFRFDGIRGRWILSADSSRF
jgi:hypothetical protein